MTLPCLHSIRQRALLSLVIAMTAHTSAERMKKCKNLIAQIMEPRRVYIEWKLNILDIVAVTLALLSILVTIYLAYYVSNIHGHVERLAPDVSAADSRH